MTRTTPLISSSRPFLLSLKILDRLLCSKESKSCAQRCCLSMQGLSRSCWLRKRLLGSPGVPRNRIGDLQPRNALHHSPASHYSLALLQVNAVCMHNPTTSYIGSVLVLSLDVVQIRSQPCFRTTFKRYTACTECNVCFEKTFPVH